jgi:hypothetical protein
MESKHDSEKTGADTMIFYGVSVTDADLIMTDGKSLEHAGVTPDEIVLPTAADLASGRDSVLSRAAELLGVKISPADAGKLFSLRMDGGIGHLTEYALKRSSEHGERAALTILSP